jgi:dolichyl-diphosphooligosaccharide--protein glycosyltransferase
MGMYFTIKNPTNRNVFLLLFGLTTLYFAGSMVRLLVLLAPAFALLAAGGVTGLLKPFYTLLRESGSQVVAKSKRSLRKVSREYSAIAILIIFALLVTNFAFTPQTDTGQPRVYASVYSPIAISAASLPVTPNEPIPQWKNLLSYTRTNLAATDVVSAWWDYGDWLGIYGNVTTLCDNTTVNATQIENVGYSMMAPENMSLKMLSNYNAKYVLVFLTLQLTLSSDNTQITGVQFGGYGDEGKWYWMARISGEAQTRLTQEGYMNNDLWWNNETTFANTTYTSSGTSSLNWTQAGLDSTIFKLMSDAEQQYANQYGLTVADQTASAPTYFTAKFISGLEAAPADVAQNYGLLVPIVALYEINWDAYNAATNSTVTP